MITRTAKDIVKDEVLLNASWLIQDLASGECSGHLAEQAQALSEPILDYESAAIDAGLVQDEGRLVWLAYDHDQFASHQEADQADALEVFETAEGACRAMQVDPFELEPCEFWAVSEWLAVKLHEQGEKVCADFANLHIWARTTTGQLIEEDGVIQRIAEKTAQDTRRALGCA